MSHHMRPPQYVWGYDWPDDCPPLYYGRVRFTDPPPAHARVALHLPPCKPRAGINTDWSGNKCAMLHTSSSYALLPAAPAQVQASQSVPSSAHPQASQPPPAQSQASQPAPPVHLQAPQSPPAQSLASQPAPPAQPQASQPAPPAADPVTVGQAPHDHVPQAPTMSSLGFDVAIGLGLALAFVVVRRFILDMIEPPRPSL
jgi:hypothetical protein